MEQKKYVPKNEAVTYAVAALGQGLVYSCMSSYITDFYMNVLLLSPMFVIMLMLLARVWDAVNDPMMGMIVDRHKSKWGRFRPYPIITALPIALLTIMMFTKPSTFGVNSTGTVMYVYVAAVYIIWGMVYTSSDVPFWSMPNLMTPNHKERAKIISYGRTVGGIGSAVTVALPIILGFIPALSSRDDFNDIKYPIMAVSMAVIGMPLFMMSSFKVKERIAIPNATKRSKNDPSTLSRVFHCKPLLLVVLAGMLSFGRYMLQSAAPHVARYAGFYLGIDPATATNEQINSNMSTVAMIIQICAAVGMFGSMVVLPKLYNKFEYRTLMIGSCAGGFVAGVLALLVGWFTKNLFACIPFFIIMSIPLGVINVVSGIMVFDCIDYMEWKTGYRDNGLGASCQSFVNKIGNAFATVAIIAMYMFVNIDVKMLNEGGAAAITAASTLSSGQNFAMYSLVTLVPAVSLLLTAVPLIFYDFTGEKKNKVMSELNEKRKERGIVIEAK
ncbi:MAG: MFS transporter [Oscillospiraceae bacterium]|nr:MFS transporter [Oscillospiraceae bacterium]